MTRNELQVRIEQTTYWVGKFSELVSDFKKQPATVLRNIQLEAAESQLEDLQAQLKELQAQADAAAAIKE